jgi:hypothetical protein
MMSIQFLKESVSQFLTFRGFDRISGSCDLAITKGPLFLKLEVTTTLDATSNRRRWLGDGVVWGRS